ncbi:MAG: radical SAM protein [Desulfobacteraceae bacterium]|nr:radical SAM protein [Desulfobacteraceae bacterium]
MRIDLVAVHTCPSPQAVPLANAFLQSYLTTVPLPRPVEVVRSDFFLGQDPVACAAGIVKLQPDLVGFSLYVWNRGLCGEIAEELRRCLPGVTIFAGGPEATADPLGVLAGTRFDFLIAGEGEVPFAALCERLSKGGDVSRIPGVATRAEAGISLIPSTPLANLDAIPSPWLNGTLDVDLYPGILWQLSRGCGFACDFCFDSRDRHGVRRFSLERIEAELRHFASHAVSQVFVLDSTFNQDQRRAKTILRLIKKIAPHIHFHFEVRSEFIDREMAELFAGITCSLQIGLQSADPRVLKQVGRAFRRDDFVSRTMLLNESGAVFGFDLMYGLPGDTLSGFRDSLEFALGLYPNHLDIFPLAILPGTALAGRADSIGLRHLPGPPYTLNSSATFTEADMQEARKLALACDIFYTRGRAVAWFNGVLDALGQRPAEFLQRFAAWLESEKGAVISEADLGDDQIWHLQRAFLSGAFSPKRVRRFLPVVLDLVDYHYHYAVALMTPPPRPANGTAGAKKPLQSAFRLAGSARLAAFRYEILEILEAGVADVRGFSGSLQQSGSWAVIYPTAEGVFTESVSELYYRLLEQMDGATPAGDLAARLGIPAAEAGEFLAFAEREGILERC